MTDIQREYAELLKPSDSLIADIAKIKGDIIILGVGGKMGPSIARLAREASDRAGIKRKIIGVSRFSEAGLKESLEQSGISTITADLLDDAQINNLPEAENVLYLAGTKFGTTGKESFTWAMNSYLPGRVAQKFAGSRIVAFSTGNVYPLTSVKAGGADEQLAPDPLGEYAQSCLGRERLFQYYSSKNNTPVLIYRLNYANDLSYGVLLEIARSVYEGREINLDMGHVNVIWQGDANEWAIRCLNHCEPGGKILNIAGPETASVRWIANEFGKLLKKSPIFSGEEQATALLSNAAEAYRLFGYPRVPLKKMLELIAGWVREGGQTLNKPTHFQERKGKF